MSQSAVASQDEIPAKLLQFVDDAVVKALPTGTRAVGLGPGDPKKKMTFKINAFDAQGQETPFFLKIDRNEMGKKAVIGEFYGTKKLYEVMPEIFSEPIGCGTFKSDPTLHFYVCRYRVLTSTFPDSNKLPAELAEMHRRGRCSSPTAKFGWPITNHCTTQTFKQEEAVHGPDPELDLLREALIKKVVPRLLRPLETGGRKIVPTLVHGDLWDGNTSVEEETGKSVLFDPLPLYAHNEYDLAPWFVHRHKMTDKYVAEYTKHMEISEPKAEFHDRGLLYSISFDLQASSLYRGNLDRRNYVKNHIKTLLHKYPLGYEGFLKEDEVTA